MECHSGAPDSFAPGIPTKAKVCLESQVSENTAWGISRHRSQTLNSEQIEFLYSRRSA
jgi:hypothetical protein